MELGKVKCPQRDKLIKTPEQNNRRDDTKEIAKNRNLKNRIGASKHPYEDSHKIECKDTKQQNTNGRQ